MTFAYVDAEINRVVAPHNGNDVATSDLELHNPILYKVNQINYIHQPKFYNSLLNRKL